MTVMLLLFENDQTNHKSKKELNLNHMVAEQHNRSNAITMYCGFAVFLSFSLSPLKVLNGMPLYCMLDLN